MAHTADLGRDELPAIRALLDASFADLDDTDWDHALGGLHALARAGGELIGHAAVVQRHFLHAGRTLRAGYVECVAVRADRRRQGHAGAQMAEVERVVRAAYDLGALSASGAGAALYAGRGWRQWSGRTSALTPAGIVRTPAEDSTVHVLPVTAPLDLAGELTCDWRAGDLW